MRGYPVDKRRDGQRKRAAASVEGDFEWSAARVVARLTGDRVVLQDDNSEPSMPDLRIDYSDGRCGYIEAVVDIDRAYAALQGEIRRRGHRLSVPTLDHKWFIWLSRHAQLKDLRSNLPRLLADMAARGQLCPTLTKLAVPGSPADPHLVKLSTLGVTRLWTQPPDKGDTGLIHFVPEGTGGPTRADWPAFDEALADVLSNDGLADVPRKLTQAGGSERHIFLGTSWTTPWVINRVLSDQCDDLPPIPPTLPAGVTHLWLWRYDPPGRCLHWSPISGWLESRLHWSTH